MDDIKLVASDIDGTLLFGWDPNGIDPQVFEQIRELRRRGIAFLVSSGRQYGNLRHLFEPVADDIYYLCENGCLVIVDNEVVLKRTMDTDLALELSHAIMGTPGCDLMISGERVSYVLSDASDFADHVANVVGNAVAFLDAPEDMPEDFFKISFRAEPDRMREVADGFVERFGDRLHVTVSGLTWFDVMPLGADKGTAMQALGDKLGISPADMMAFGDNLNDTEMLELVGHPYLMSSGNETLADLNDRIRRCERVNDVLAELLATTTACR